MDDIVRRQVERVDIFERSLMQHEPVVGRVLPQHGLCLGRVSHQRVHDDARPRQAVAFQQRAGAQRADKARGAGDEHMPAGERIPVDIEMLRQ